ncbi:hypothetical protein D1871_13365 [Nakamurella silvestris]|nr:hypothetical protein D1871_13365 [Nakamurella silvestris]
MSQDISLIDDTITEIVGRIWQSADLVDDLHDLCDTGGRVAGTDSELAARALLKDKLRQISDTATIHTFPVSGRVTLDHSVQLIDATGPVTLQTTALLNSPATDGPIDLEVVDLGRGTRGDFEAAASLIPGRAVLVRHEFPFTTGHIHRGIKYGWAVEAGAAAFLIANNLPDVGPISGSGGSGVDSDIPGIGMSYESGRRLATAAARGQAGIRIDLTSEQRSWTAENLVLDLPGRTDEVITLTAHYDGHSLGESAMDNGSGIAVVLEVARRLQPVVSQLRRGIRVLFFTFEEWSLTGSERYLEDLSEEEKALIRFNINVDTPVGHPRLNVLTAGDADLEELARRTGAAGGAPVGVVRAPTSNSDHYNFLRAGIPAARLIGGYDDPTAVSRYLLSAADTRDKVEPADLRAAAMSTAVLVLHACNYEG